MTIHVLFKGVAVASANTVIDALAALKNERRFAPDACQRDEFWKLELSDGRVVAPGKAAQ